MGRVLVVDPSKLFRLGLRASLERPVPDGAAAIFQVVGECGSAAEALELAAREAPDLVVTDLNLTDRSGVVLARELRRAHPAVRVVILAEEQQRGVMTHALAAGAVGFLFKTQQPQEILEALAAALAGRQVLPQGARVNPRQRLAGRAPAHLLDLLSRREREVFDLVVWGCANKQVAGRLGISPKTVETHRGHINRKLGVHTTADLVRFASLWGALAPTGAADGISGWAASPAAPSRSLM
jgi:two-component system response regulator NreC